MAGKNVSELKYILDGPDRHYDNYEKSYLNKALNDVRELLSSKKFPSTINQGFEHLMAYDDNCSVQYQYLRIDLK